jgi:hypothetical protein
MNGEQSLQHTRALIRQALLSAGARVRPPPDAAHPTLEKTELRTLALPGVDLVLVAVQYWWRQHTLHGAATLILKVLESVVRLAAMRRPRTLLLIAFVAGGALVRHAPWRWLLRPTVIQALVARWGWAVIRRRSDP